MFFLCLARQSGRETVQKGNGGLLQVAEERFDRTGTEEATENGPRRISEDDKVRHS